jgi:hypothetical protein
MDSFQFWLYVIVAVIYLVSKAIQKSNRQAREQGPRKQRPPQEEGTEQLPPITFEELLREITEGKQRKTAAPPPKPAPQSRPAQKPVAREYVDYDEDIEDEVKSLERVNYDTDREAATLQVYEQAKRQAELKSSLETLRSSLKSIESTPTVTVRGKKRNRLLEECVRELRSPSGLKKAVVLNEILRPKF